MLHRENPNYMYDIKIFDEKIDYDKKLCEYMMDVFSEYYMEYDFIIYFKGNNCKTIEIKKEWLISWTSDELVMYYYEDDEKMLDDVPLGCIVIPKIFAIVRKNEE